LNLRRLLPWLVLAVFLLAVALTVLWVRAEARRVRQIQQLNAPAAPGKPVSP
jgi:hypothetical protein